MRLLDVAIFKSFLPQLIAGPIVRFHDVADQIRSRSVGIEDFAEGVRRFIVGLAQPPCPEASGKSQGPISGVIGDPGRIAQPSPPADITNFHGSLLPMCGIANASIVVVLHRTTGRSESPRPYHDSFDQTALPSGFSLIWHREYP
jgi:hypothetical protein